MEPASYRLRRMCKEDLDWVLKARNSKSVREGSLNTDKIKKKHHRIWFDCSVNMWKFVFTENDKPVGVVLLDKVSQYWSFYLVPSARKHSGLGRLMLSQFLVYAKKRGIKSIKAEVKEVNWPSRRLHMNLGFGSTFKGKDGVIGYRKDF